MIFLLSPAKSLDFDSPAIIEQHTLPVFAQDCAELVAQLRSQTVPQLAALMSLSDKLATLNVARFDAWRPQFTASNSKQALLAFNGDVYEGLAASTLNESDILWAQEHLLMLSGLYGVLRPLDWIQPYRLEMGTAWSNPRGKDLYAWWGDRLANYLNERLQMQDDDTVVNLASQEYFKAVKRKALKARVVDCVFEDWKNGQYKIISFHAKKARGLMARYAITKRVKSLLALRKFNAQGYAFDESASDSDRMVFRRKLI